MDEIECIVCNNKIRFPSYINTTNYDGQIYCKDYQLLLDIKLVESEVIKYKIAVRQTKPRPPNITIVTRTAPPPSQWEGDKGDGVVIPI